MATSSARACASRLSSCCRASISPSSSSSSASPALRSLPRPPSSSSSSASASASSSSTTTAAAAAAAETATKSAKPSSSSSLPHYQKSKLHSADTLRRAAVLAGSIPMSLTCTTTLTFSSLTTDFNLPRAPSTDDDDGT